MLHLQDGLLSKVENLCSHAEEEVSTHARQKGLEPTAPSAHESPWTRGRGQVDTLIGYQVLQPWVHHTLLLVTSSPMVLCGSQGLQEVVHLGVLAQTATE